MLTKLEKAIIFATNKHQGQKRKAKLIPYIVHPLEVMDILRKNGADEDTMIVGVLHDTVEDTNTTSKEIENEFGKEISYLVEYESEHKGGPYRERKQEHMDRLKIAPKKAKMVNCADKLSNLSAILVDYEKKGEDLWKIFNGSKKDIVWYYGIAINALSELDGMNMYEELKQKYLKLASL